jgi:hypothetical protein
VKKRKEDVPVKMVKFKSILCVIMNLKYLEFHGGPSYIVVLKNRYKIYRNISEKVKVMEGSLSGTATVHDQQSPALH